MNILTMPGRGDLLATDVCQEFPLSSDEIEAKILSEECFRIDDKHYSFGSVMQRIEQEQYELTLMLVNGEITPEDHGKKVKELALTEVKKVARQ